MPQMKFKIGQRVCTNHAFSSPTRWSKIAEYRQTSMGEWIYILADGGWFSEHELSDAT